jgi:plastocyanin
VVRRLGLVTAGWLALAATALPGGARAADAKVAIGHYQWNQSVVNVDLGQHVTWYWVGPDTMHSVTGTSDNDASVDSDPRRSEPEHRLGDHFSVTFTRPGIYTFQCKLHPVVHGTVVVSATPGNPADDPDPIPPLAISLIRPTLSDPFLAPASPSVRGGADLHFTLDDPATLDAEVWHASRRGRITTYAGWNHWKGHIGYNDVPLLVPRGHLRLAAGRYLAFLTATDPFYNVSRRLAVHFTVRR